MFIFPVFFTLRGLFYWCFFTVSERQTQLSMAHIPMIPTLHIYSFSFYPFTQPITHHRFVSLGRFSMRLTAAFRILADSSPHAAGLGTKKQAYHTHSPSSSSFSTAVLAVLGQGRRQGCSSLIWKERQRCPLRWMTALSRRCKPCLSSIVVFGISGGQLRACSTYVLG